jgi:hypothetical protein
VNSQVDRSKVPPSNVSDQLAGATPERATVTANTKGTIDLVACIFFLLFPGASVGSDASGEYDDEALLERWMIVDWTLAPRDSSAVEMNSRAASTTCHLGI